MAPIVWLSEIGIAAYSSGGTKVSISDVGAGTLVPIVNDDMAITTIE